MSELDQAALIYLCVMGSASIIALAIETLSRMSDAFGLAPVLRLIALQWWKAALRELSARDPMHADIPRIVLRVHALENAS